MSTQELRTVKAMLMDSEETSVCDSLKASDFKASSESEAMGYHTVDVIAQLRKNVEQIEELQSRVRFMMSEIKGVLPRQ